MLHGFGEQNSQPVKDCVPGLTNKMPIGFALVSFVSATETIDSSFEHIE